MESGGCNASWNRVAISGSGYFFTCLGLSLAGSKKNEHQKRSGNLTDIDRIKSTLILQTPYFPRLPAHHTHTICGSALVP